MTKFLMGVLALACILLVVITTAQQQRWKRHQDEMQQWIPGMQIGVDALELCLRDAQATTPTTASR